jgi:hypothetical protein
MRRKKNSSYKRGGLTGQLDKDESLSGLLQVIMSIRRRRGGCEGKVMPVSPVYPLTRRSTLPKIRGI